MSDRYAWSTDEERYYGSFDSIEEAFADADHEECWIGIEYQPHAEGYVNADLVLERITCQDEYSIDAADDWPHASAEQRAELTRLLQQTVGDWLDRNKLRETFFLVRDVKQYSRVDGQVVEMKGGE